MSRRIFARRSGGQFMRQPSLEAMGLCKPHNTKGDGTWCGAINPVTGKDELGRPVLPTVCGHCGESLDEPRGEVSRG